MLIKDNTGLIVIDIQGKLAHLVDDSTKLISNCVKLIKGSNELGLPIILLEQNPEKLSSTVDELTTILTDITPITKYTFDACASLDFLNSIKNNNVDTWLVCGIEAHICVYQTARGLAEQGYKVELVSDCVSSRTLLNKQLAVNRLQDCGVEITGLEMCLYELVRDCRTPEFKQILDLVR
ncbi:hydrolase [Pseudocolwellia sp. AS88]|uniref:hydrolase n=1 Tax=Pseudocolwellia sp. AS88 TaxID=3063958 RepID=UPI0026EF1270|nr:hydrolase [Pseudocolwellia sp. AS88]MDO7085681.1 hydrolase [Pseudocolwellia sp. AS88]